MQLHSLNKAPGVDRSVNGQKLGFLKMGKHFKNPLIKIIQQSFYMINI
jgi:hypothetical protein